MTGGLFRSWAEGGSYRVWMNCGLTGVNRPGVESKLRSFACEVYAPAVVDDFGDLVIVGRWS